jgi:arabinogalactan endo-1,4-beta-galactosidase
MLRLGLAIAALLAFAPAAHASSDLVVNRALGADVKPAAAGALVDGDATTTYCPDGPVVVDLGRPVPLTGAGVTMKDAARVSLALSVNGRDWTSRSVDAPAGGPAYVRYGDRARYLRFNGGCAGELRMFGAGPDDFAKGADLSFTLLEEDAGTVFTDRGRAKPVEKIFADHGANYVRLRLWLNPPAGYPDLLTDLEMARRFKAAGMKLYLDFHYSDFWADPQHQDTPSSWAGQDLATMSRTVQTYTRRVLQAFAAQGTPVDLVSIGNEIRNGILWPTGQLSTWSDAEWNALGTLLKAGVAGARAGNPRGHKLRVMLHYDQGGDNGGSRAFFDHIKAQGVPYDVIGLSYYSFWHGHLRDLRANVNDLAVRYGKDVMVAEIQYAWTLGYGDSTNNFVWEESQLEPGYPASPDGQLSFVNDVLSILAAVPGGRGDGLFYWEPEWVPRAGAGWTPGEGTPNDNLTLFDFGGAALPSIGIFEDPRLHSSG